jgi:NADH dehydrogenase (ubiquinone) 1 alpha subcomplex subunit 12
MFTNVYPVFSQRKYVGQDIHGNRYYEALNPKDAIHCRNRFVLFKDYTNYDASDIPAEWFGWLHKTIDTPPTTKHQASQSDAHDKDNREHELFPTSRGYNGHFPNWTGTTGKYVPYSTTRSKIQPWTQ